MYDCFPFSVLRQIFVFWEEGTVYAVGGGVGVDKARYVGLEPTQYWGRVDLVDERLERIQFSFVESELSGFCFAV